MTATIIESDVDSDLDSLLDWKHVPPCEAVYDDGYVCQNEAYFVCSVSCCMAKILLCEDCFYGFNEYAKKYAGVKYICDYCNKRFTLEPDHLKVIGRV